MKKPKKEYVVYRCDCFDYGDGHIDESIENLGTTWAVSEAQAINNVMFRNGITWYDCVADYECDGGRRTNFKAVLKSD